MRVLRPALYVLVAFAPSQVFAAGLVPHRAVYDLALGQASTRSGITGASGRLVYEFDGSACDGYTTTFRVVTRIDAEGVSQMNDLQTTSYESANGDAFEFVSKSFLGDKLDKEVKGSARKQDGAVDVLIERPERKEMELEETRFPTHHTINLIEKALSGERFYEDTIFDGSEDADKVLTTTAIIGERTGAAPDDAETPALGTMAGDRYWPVDMAYFDTSAGEEVPSYRISFKLHESGLTRDLEMDYGEFSLTGRLVGFEPLGSAGGGDCVR